LREVKCKIQNRTATAGSREKKEWALIRKAQIPYRRVRRSAVGALRHNKLQKPGDRRSKGTSVRRMGLRTVTKYKKTGSES
jgi:hypothetical protein